LTVQGWRNWFPGTLIAVALPKTERTSSVSPAVSNRLEPARQA